jgi:hypothetical protein
VKDQFVYPLNDIAANNPGLFLETVKDVFAGHEYLRALLVYGCDPDEGTYLNALCGNGCVQLVNLWPSIVKRLCSARCHTCAWPHF